MNRKWQRSTSKHIKKGRSPTGNGMQQGEERQKREKKATDWENRIRVQEKDKKNKRGGARERPAGV